MLYIYFPNIFIKFTKNKRVFCVYIWIYFLSFHASFLIKTVLKQHALMIKISMHWCLWDIFSILCIYLRYFLEWFYPRLSRKLCLYLGFQYQETCCFIYLIINCYYPWCNISLMRTLQKLNFLINHFYYFLWVNFLHVLEIWLGLLFIWRNLRIKSVLQSGKRGSSIPEKKRRLNMCIDNHLSGHFLFAFITL